MLASVQNVSRQLSPPICTNVGLQNLIFENEFFKSPNGSKSGNFRSIGFWLLKFQIYGNIILWRSLQ